VADLQNDLSKAGTAIAICMGFWLVIAAATVAVDSGIHIAQALLAGDSAAAAASFWRLLANFLPIVWDQRFIAALMWIVYGVSVSVRVAIPVQVLLVLATFGSTAYQRSLRLDAALVHIAVLSAALVGLSLAVRLIVSWRSAES
jgi:putative intracellular protease/amidase